MKNLSVFFAVIMAATAVFFAYKYYNVKNLSISIDKKRCSDCMDYNNQRPSSKLDFNLLRTMASNYQNDPTTAASNPGKTRSVWISLEKLKQFVYDIESKTCSCPDNKLGVRIYFAKYPPNSAWTSPTAFKNDLNNPQASEGDFLSTIITKYGSNAYQNINTIFMVPTINTGNGNFDFDPADTTWRCTGGYDITRFMKRISGKEFNSFNYFSVNSLGISVTALSATNHGDACPPPPSGGSCLSEGAYFDY